MGRLAFVWSSRLNDGFGVRYFVRENVDGVSINVGESVSSSRDKGAFFE